VVSKTATIVDVVLKSRNEIAAKKVDMATTLSALLDKWRHADHPSQDPLHRRSFLHATGKFAAVALAVPVTVMAQKTGGQAEQERYYDVSTNENLMRQHGILKRVMLMYEEVIRRIDARQDFPAQTVIDAAGIVRKFIEDYHEKIEEEHLFPLFRKYYRRDDVLRLYAQKLVDLVDILDQQHPAGRRLTDRILSTLHSLKTPDDHQKLAHDLRAFIRMYAPHMAREDTVLYPALHVIASRQEYEVLGEKFDQIERKTFGTDGFDIYLDQVTAFEKYLGIYDLAQFTPK
jgi:hemerythrin-like domain-containing protein